MNFGRHLGDLWVQLESLNPTFLVKIKKNTENEFQEPLWKKHESIMKIDAKMRGLGKAPQAYRSMLPSIYEVSAGRDFAWFSVHKRHVKS